jgi:putative phosphoserine phosphatase/1-acylglycerol-3-phosphate O-acyltransferase
VAPSPLLARRSLSRRFEALDLPLAEFRRAAKAGEGSLNDAYLAGVAGALRLYHEQLGVRVRELPAAIPISTRRDDDPAGGNHWAGAQLALPIGEADPRARMQRIRELVLSARAEPALNALNVAAGLIDLLPTSVLGALMTNVKGVDVQASNVPGPAHRMYLAGAEVVRSYVFGPLPGPALMTVLYSQSGVCNLGVNCDAAAISQRDTFAQCLREGFDEVLALGRPGAVAERRPAHAIGAEQASPLLASPRLPGTVAEIEAAPAGPQVAAFFDLDGTLLAGYSGQAFAMEGLRQGELGAAGFARMLRVSLEGTPGAARFAELLRLGGEMWRGRGVDELEELGERLFRQKLLDTLHLEGRELVAAHQRRGHTVVLTSSATRFQVAPVARELGIEHVLCNDFVAEDGRLTGEPTLPILWGEGKASAAQAFARERKLDLARSYFYADGNEEAPLMHLVGNPRPTNPQPELERIAARRGWPVLRFTTRAPLGAAGTLRNVAGIASLVPAAVGGLALGALRDKQAGVEFTAQRWLGSWFAAAGVTLRVHGEEHLREPRPAIFIWNHVNNFDALMVAKLIEGKVVSVGKKELENAPIVGQLGKLMGTAFIDRADTASAVAALKPIQDRLADGYSVMIAPEGTRRGSGGLGPFKKGAFRMAMAGGVPIIPIVIRNALDVAPTDAALLRPGTVDVAVLPPVSVADWKHGELAERIEGVRQLFLATLASWPSSDAAGE